MMVGIIGTQLHVLGSLVSRVFRLREDILPAQDQMPLHALRAYQVVLVVGTYLGIKRMKKIDK